MRIDESKIINSAKITIDDIMTSIKDPDMDGWTEFYLGKVYAYMDVLAGLKDCEVHVNENQ